MIKIFLKKIKNKQYFVAGLAQLADLRICKLCPFAEGYGTTNPQEGTKLHLVMRQQFWGMWSHLFSAITTRSTITQSDNTC